MKKFFMYAIVAVAIATGVILSLFFVSCSQKADKDNGETQTITFPTEDNTGIYDSLTVSFLQFEETGESLIESVDKIVDLGDRIIVGDDGAYKFLFFDKSGKYLASVDHRGEGPGEYVSFESFFVDRKTNRLGVYDADSHKIVYYDIDSYKFLEEKSYPDIMAGCVEPLGENLVWYNQAYEGDNSDYYFLVTDKDGKIVNRFVDKKFKSGYLTGAAYPLYRFDGKLYGYTPYDMAVYEFDDNAAEKKMTFDIAGFLSPTLDFLNECSSEGRTTSLFKALSESDFVSYYDVVETERLLCVTLMRQRECYLAILDKISGKKVLTPLKDFANTLAIGEIDYMTPESVDNGILAIVDKTTLKENTTADLSDDLKALVANDNDNPIVAIIKSK